MLHLVQPDWTVRHLNMDENEYNCIVQCDFYKSPTLIRLMLVDGIIWVNKNNLAGAHR